MKNTQLLALILGLFIFSCSNNEEDFIPENKITIKDDSCPCEDIRPDPSSNATWCCVQRNTEIHQDSIIEYEYSNNFIANTFGWHVEGDIEVVSGIDSNVIRVRLKENFESGVLIGFSEGDFHRCGNRVNISADVESDHEQ